MVKKAFLALVLSFTILQAGEKILEFSFDPGHVKLGQSRGYVTVTYEDYAHVNPYGAPMLPSKGLSILIPANSSFQGYEILSMSTKSIASGYKVMPQQKPVPISYKVPTEFIGPLDKFYKKNAFYPESPVKFGKVGNMSGFRLTSFLVYPVIYNPVSGELKVITHLVLKVKYEEGKRVPSPITHNELTLLRNQLKGLVVNPEDIDVFAPPLRN